MKKALMIIAIVAIVAITGSLIYYLVFFRPGIEKAEIRLQEEKQASEKLRIETEKKDKEQKEIDKKTGLVNALAYLEKWHNDSLDQAYKDYSAQWKKACEDLGMKFTTPPESLLPKATADMLNEYYDKAVERIDESYQSQKDDIYNLYE